MKKKNSLSQTAAYFNVYKLNVLGYLLDMLMLLGQIVFVSLLNALRPLSYNERCFVITICRDGMSSMSLAIHGAFNRHCAHIELGSFLHGAFDRTFN